MKLLKYAIVSISVSLHLVCAQWCEQLPENSWASLLQVINASPYPELKLCPFKIEGDKCDIGGQGFAVNTTNLSLECDDFNSFGEKCIINCPGRHFTINPGYSLKLSNFELKGATNSSIKVLERSSLLSIFCKWERYVILILTNIELFRVVISS